MDDKDCYSHVLTAVDDIMDIISATEIKEELLSDEVVDAAVVDSQLSDAETEDDGDVNIVDVEKTMQYLSGSIYVGSHYK